jgi:hypothetical protein
MAMLLSASSVAQVDNGSFEEGGDHWSDPCGQASYVDGGATGCGEMHAQLPLFYSGSPCDPATAGMIMQKLPWVQNGDAVELAFWYSGIADDEEDQQWVAMNSLMASVNGTGHLMSSGDPQGEIAFFVGEPGWQYLSRTIMYTLSPGDTAVIALGGSGLSYATGVIHFDDVHVSLSASTALHPAGTSYSALGWYDGANVHIAASSHAVQPPECSDAMGRVVALASNGTAQDDVYSTEGLMSGTYTFRANTTAGPCVVRFAK